MKIKSRVAPKLAIATAAEGGWTPPKEAEVGELTGTKGVVFVEYVALLLLVTIIGAAAVLSLGVPLMTLFRYQWIVLSLPIP
jgi:hypothetical protein